MAKKEKSTLLPHDTIVEVVMRKSMTMSEYERIKNNSKSKGWNIQAYQEGVYSDGLGKKV
ncbi:hypothetical protein HX063_17245 [Myroides odoratimimus]|uniref:hypothetical protein n=1 Tax=Myroides odoratimimus TaxID=76832 RepID=UPI00257819A0|nr:hypothetical protein [Myroides odoratimimus]MDM1497116.1 hypothetical protein [Myroides odoratimimus]MDM1499040.1 hypothetical protein [Myroides odoratimimus]